MNELIEKVKAWGVDKGITGQNGKGTLLSQLEKTQEELTETRDAAVLLTHLAKPRDHKELVEKDFARSQVMDGIGDTIVTLILAAEIAGLDIQKCLQFAYDEIKGRKGKMIGGQFVKESKRSIEDDLGELDILACQIGDETCESCQ